MTIGTLVSGAPPLAPAGLFVPTSCEGKWVQLHDDATATAATAAELLNPTGFGIATAHWIEIKKPASKLCRVRARVPRAITAVSTQLIVQLYAAWATSSFAGSPAAEGYSANVPLTDGSVKVERLDASTWAAAGLTLTMQGSPTTSNQACDAAYWYSTSALQTPADLHGATHLLCLVSQAMVKTGTGTPIVEGLLIN